MLTRFRATIVRGDSLLVAIATFAVLAVFISADPPKNATFSVGPFTDEAFNVVNARNFVLFGQFSFDQWNLYLVNAPFTALMTAAFALFGVGLVQARLAMAVCVAVGAGLLVAGLRRSFGRAPAALAGFGFAFSGLMMFYGRLAFVEDLVALGLIAGAMTLTRPDCGLRSGLAAGLCFAMAIGSKPLGAFSVAGIAVALAFYAVARERSLLRWVAGVVAVVAAAGLVWVAVIGIPYRAEVAIDLKIWPQYTFPRTPAELLTTAARFLRNSDGVLGPLAGPLIALAALGSVASALRWRSLESDARRLVVASWGWIAAGAGIVVIAGYQPNRYFVPVVPAFSVLAAAGLHATIDWLRSRVSEHTSSRVVRTLAASTVAVAVLPGLLLYAGWFSSPRYDTVTMERGMRTAVAPGTKVGGGASAVALLESKAVAIVFGLANQVDFYSQGMRYYVEPINSSPPIGVPAGIWAKRQTLKCAEWLDSPFCLFSVP